jgi:hypothetical protein
MRILHDTIQVSDIAKRLYTISEEVLQGGFEMLAKLER